jgi:hypothetical protein
MKNTLKLAGLLTLALIAMTACTPKKSAEQITAEAAAMEYVLDSSGEWLIFRTSRQLKDISFISVSFRDNNFYQGGMDGSVSLMEFQNNPPARSASVDYIGSFS